MIVYLNKEDRCRRLGQCYVTLFEIKQNDQCRQALHHTLSPESMLVKKRFSGTFGYFLTGSSESCANEQKVSPNNCVLRHICADMCTMSLISLSLL